MSVAQVAKHSFDGKTIIELVGKARLYKRSDRLGIIVRVAYIIDGIGNTAINEGTQLTPLHVVIAQEGTDGEIIGMITTIEGFILRFIRLMIIA